MLIKFKKRFAPNGIGFPVWNEFVDEHPGIIDALVSPRPDDPNTFTIVLPTGRLLQTLAERGIHFDFVSPLDLIRE